MQVLIIFSLLHNWCEVSLSISQLISVTEYVQAGGVFMSPVVEVIGGDDHPVSSDVGGSAVPVVQDLRRPSALASDISCNTHGGSMFLLGKMTGSISESAEIFGVPVEPIVYARYLGHVRDAIRISRQGYWQSDIPSPFRTGSRTARHGDAWRTRSFDKVEVVDRVVWIVY